MASRATAKNRYALYLRWLMMLKPWIIIEGGVMKRDFPPVHPGEILLEEFLSPFGISQYRLSKDIGVPAIRINKIIHGERGISADTALRLARYFGMSVELWTGIQTHYDTELARMNLGDRLEIEVKVLNLVA